MSLASEAYLWEVEGFGTKGLEYAVWCAFSERLLLYAAYAAHISPTRFNLNMTIAAVLVSIV